MNNKEMLIVLSELDTVSGLYKADFLNNTAELSETTFKELRNKLDFKDVEVSLIRESQFITIFEYKTIYKGITITATEIESK